MPASSTERAGPAPGRAVRPPQKALRQARPGARHRPRAAPAAALRGRDPHRADRRRCATATPAQVEGVVTDCRGPVPAAPPARRDAGRRHATTCVLRFLHFYPTQQKALAAGTRVRVRGEVRGGFFGLEMVHPHFKVVAAGAPLPTALTPVYPTTRAAAAGATCARRSPPALARADLAETLPRRRCVPPRRCRRLRDALRFLHHPPPGRRRSARSTTAAHPAWPRLKFDELLAQQLSRCRRKRERARAARAGARAAHRRRCTTRCCAALPFTLTARAAARRREIARRPDARACRCSGCCRATSARGKTVVAALAALQAIDAGWQGALMAPTEILAEQHLPQARRLARRRSASTVAWLTGSRKAQGAQRRCSSRWPAGEAALVVGTHALFQERCRVRPARPRDRRRAASLRRRAAAGACAARAATALRAAPADDERDADPAHARDDASTPTSTSRRIDELPPGRTPVVDAAVRRQRRDEVVDADPRRRCAQGRQVYWVCPLIEESRDARAADRGRAASPSSATALPGAAGRPAARPHAGRRRRRR